MSKKFVYNNVEVKLTGRKANKRSSRSNNKIISTVFEITPSDIEEGSWKKWVKFSDLYEIEQEEE